MLLVLQDDVEQLMVGLPQQLRGKEGHFLSLGGEGVDEELDDSAALLLHAEPGCVFEDDFQCEY